MQFNSARLGGRTGEQSANPSDQVGHDRWMKVDCRGDEVYSRDINGVEEWKEYDDAGRLIYMHNSIGYWQKSAYNPANGDLTLPEGTRMQRWYTDTGSIVWWSRAFADRTEYYDTDGKYLGECDLGYDDIRDGNDDTLNPWDEDDSCLHGIRWLV